MEQLHRRSPAAVDYPGLANHLLPPGATRWLKGLYWLIFPGFYLLMLTFIWPSLDKSLTWMALITCTGLTLALGDRRLMTLNFIAGAGLGDFLERWGTIRECWTYYTLQTPPLFAVLAHGLAAAAFWRGRELLVDIWRRLIHERTNPGLHPGERRFL